MIEITITRRTREVYKVRENTVTERTPTQLKKTTSYGEEPAYAEKFTVQEVEKVNERTETLLRQDLPDSGFNLNCVIAAINGIEVA